MHSNYKLTILIECHFKITRFGQANTIYEAFECMQLFRKTSISVEIVNSVQVHCKRGNDNEKYISKQFSAEFRKGGFV